jgi:hypothetical protein
MSDDALRTWLENSRKNIAALDLRLRQQTHCSRCKRKLDIATHTEDHVVRYIRFCYPCDTLENDE